MKGTDAERGSAALRDPPTGAEHVVLWLAVLIAAGAALAHLPDDLRKTLGIVAAFFTLLALLTDMSARQAGRESRLSYVAGVALAVITGGVVAGDVGEVFFDEEHDPTLGWWLMLVGSLAAGLVASAVLVAPRADSARERARQASIRGKALLGCLVLLCAAFVLLMWVAQYV